MLEGRINKEGYKREWSQGESSSIGAKGCMACTW